MKIKTVERGKIDTKYLSNLRVERNESGTGFCITAISEKFPYKIVIKRCLTKNKAEKQLKFYNEKFNAEVI